MSAAGTWLVIGNLDFEVELAGQPHALKSAVAEMISAAAGSLSVFAQPGDSLWTPAPLASERLACELELVSGPLDRLEWSGPILAWGESPSVAALRSPGPIAAEAEDWTLAVWQMHAAPAIARRVNHRGWGHELARELGVALPGAQMIASPDELDAHLATEEPWVVKAPLSASGRDRLRGRGPIIDRAARTRLERLLARGPLLYQPWLDRLVDVAAIGLVAPSGVRLLGAHRVDNDPGGVFRGIELGDLGLEPAERDLLGDTARATGEALHREGYRGPFGIDGFAYRDAAGERGFAPMCEVNARLTFGHVARAHAERAGWPAARFGLGRGLPPAGAKILVAAADPDRTAAWLAPVG